MSKIIYIVIALVFIFILSIEPLQFSGSLTPSIDVPLHYTPPKTAMTSEMYPSMSVRLTSNLKPINGYRYGNFGVPTTFYANVTNGAGTYTFRWFVNSTLVSTVTTSNNTSSLKWNFKYPSKFLGGIFDYMNVTVIDSLNQSSSASYYGSFYYEPEIFVSVSGNNKVDSSGSMNITILDWLDVSPMNLTVFVNGKPIHHMLTSGWGTGFPMHIEYNFTKTGKYNIAAVAYDDSGQRIVANLNITILSHLTYNLYLLYDDLKSDFSAVSLTFFVVFFLLASDLASTFRRTK